MKLALIYTRWRSGLEAGKAWQHARPGAHRFEPESLLGAVLYGLLELLRLPLDQQLPAQLTHAFGRGMMLALVGELHQGDDEGALVIARVFDQIGLPRTRTSY